MYTWEKWEVSTQGERISVLETKVDDLRDNVKELHDCLDKTRDSLTEKLDEMYSASCSQHAALAKELGDIKKFKDKWTYVGFGGLAVLGWVTGHLDTIAKILN